MLKTLVDVEAPGSVYLLMEVVKWGVLIDGLVLYIWLHGKKTGGRRRCAGSSVSRKKNRLTYMQSKRNPDNRKSRTVPPHTLLQIRRYPTSIEYSQIN
jgi:hypothetical protein